MLCASILFCVLFCLTNAQIGCVSKDGNRCIECNTWLHLDSVSGTCKIGEILDRYVFNGYVDEGPVNGHPRHNINVAPTKVHAPERHISPLLYIRNTANGNSAPLFGVNHFLWASLSAFYPWPKLQANGQPIDYSSIYTPESGAQISVFDVHQLPEANFVAKYKATSDLRFENVVNGHQRYYVAVEVLAGASGVDSQTDKDFFLFNQDTGESMQIFGINHWYWKADAGFYFWPVEAAAGFDQAQYTTLIKRGTTFWVMQMRPDCHPSCAQCSSPTVCIRCRDGRFVDQNGICRVGQVIDSFITTSQPVYEGVINGYPRHRVGVQANFPTTRVHNSPGMISPAVFLRNRDTGVTQKIWGINHFFWQPSSSVYIWPSQYEWQVQSFAGLYTPANNVPLDIIDLESVGNHHKSARYQVRGGIVYEGVVGAYPRYRVPVQLLSRNNAVTPDAMKGNTMYIFNENTGYSENICGVAHWHWTGTDLYFWPACTESQVNQQTWNSLLAGNPIITILQYSMQCAITGCTVCASGTVCAQCDDNYYYDEPSGQCRVGRTLDRWTTNGKVTDEGVQNGYVRQRVPVSSAKIGVAHGLESPMVYIRNANLGISKKLHGVNHFFWTGTSSLYTWYAETVAQVQQSYGEGHWNNLLRNPGSTLELYDVNTVDPVIFRSYYQSTSFIRYEGIVHSFPRYQIPIKLLSKDVNKIRSYTDYQTNNDFFIFNELTGDSIAFWGVNHWYWDNQGLYIWPVQTLGEVNDALHQRWNALLPTGSKFHIMMLSSNSCGNNKKEGREECDDGNRANGDGCSSDCLKVEDNWACPTPGRPCVGICGDNILVKGEECDDGNKNANDGCFACKVEDGWKCVSGKCNPDCGDGKKKGAEQCDDNNKNSGDGCSSLCIIEPHFGCPNVGRACIPAALNCGNSRLETAENCDDANDKPLDGCSSQCRKEDGWTCPTLGQPCVSTCGDGQVVGKEACDDSNQTPNDGCNAQCTTVEGGWTCPTPGAPCVAICGDGKKLGAETCDDGNTNDGDGCSATCATETGWTCATTPCSKICGDGIIVTDECDDGNTNNGDGCSSACVEEKGWDCPVVNTPCVATCGDAHVVSDEQCDDGNLDNGDGCDSTCKVEAAYICTDSAEHNDKWVGAVGSHCCEIPKKGVPGFICYNSRWVYNHSDFLSVSAPLELADEYLDLCGHVQIDTTLSLVNTIVSLAGSIVVSKDGHLSLTNSSIIILEHCIDALKSETKLELQEGSRVSVNNLDWYDASDPLGQIQGSFIVADGCVNVGKGDVELTAVNIPSGAHNYPFIMSTTHCVTTESGAESFQNYHHEIPGTCSNIGSFFNSTTGQEGSYDVVGFRIWNAQLCNGHVAAIVLCSILAFVILLVVVFFITSGGGGSDDYSAL